MRISILLVIVGVWLRDLVYGEGVSVGGGAAVGGGIIGAVVLAKGADVKFIKFLVLAVALYVAGGAVLIAVSYFAANWARRR